MKGKHVFVTEVKHIGKESNNLSESFGLGEHSYEFYDEPARINREFIENFDRVLNLKPKDVKDIGINRTTQRKRKKSLIMNMLKQLIKLKFCPY